MNKHLQNIITIIQQDESLSAEHKSEVLKSLKDADKELEITTFKLDRTEKVKRTTAILLEETIAELEQKRKAVEAQNRELEIEAALERARARTMAMQRSDDLKEVVNVLYEQLRVLGFQWGAAAIIIMDSAGNLDWWMQGFSDGYDLPECYHVPYFDHKGHQEQLEHWRKGSAYAVIEISGAEKKSYDNYYFNQTDFVKAPENTKQLMMQQEAVLFSMAYMQYGALSWSPSPISDEQAKILQRFAKVFEQSYTRFLDLQKAEAQALEAQIEAALEKVRSSSLAMHKSDELKHVIVVVFEKLKELGLTFDVAGIQLFTEGSKDIVQWVAALDLLSSPVLAQLPYSEKDFMESEVIRDIWTAKETGKSFLNRNYSFEEKNKFFDYAGRHNDTNTIPVDVRKFQLEAPSYTQTLVAEKHSALWVDSYRGQTILADEFVVLGRFARVFEQAYVRFLDLQKAEAQARESQIQLALERVRAKTMAMQSSTDLLGVANVLREQMGNLGQPELESSIVHLYNDDSPLLEAWYAFRPPHLLSREIITGVGIVPKDCSAWSREVMAKYNSPETEYTVVASGEKLVEWYKILERYARPTIEYDANGNLVMPDILHYHFSKFSGGALLMISNLEPSAEARELQKRAAVVFDLAYTRFLDLKKAEAQVREAKIESALEKVRSRSLAMHNSNELSELVGTLFDELIKLDLVLARCIIWILNEDKSAQLWMANSEIKQLANSYHIKRIDHSYYNAIFKGWQERNNHWVYELKDEEKASIDHILLYETELRQLPDAVKEGILASPRTFVSGAFNKFGLIEASGPVHHTEDQLQILHRFNKVFEQSYTRFLDLQKAEAQVREAQIEAALERVRSKTMAMHNSQDVGVTVATMFDELMKLGLEKTVRCGIIIVEDTKQMEVWTAADKNGKVDLVIGHLDMSVHPLLVGAYNAWKNKQPVFSYELLGDNLKGYFSAINDSPDYPVQVELDSLPVKMTNTEFYFGEGAIFTFTLQPIPDEGVQIFKRFAGVFGQTYRRFLDLQKAEAQTREAQIEAALERVRASMMAMHHSEGLPEVMKVILEQLVHLGVRLDAATFSPMDDSRDLNFWSATTEQTYPVQAEAPYIDHTLFNLIYEAKTKRYDFITINLTKEECDGWWSHFFTNTNLGPLVPEHRKEYIRSTNGYASSLALGKTSTLNVVNYAGIPFSEEENSILKRFAKVFDQSYTRFLDLQKAETQAREAQIEAVLEKIRSRSLAMHRSEELKDVIANVFERLKELTLDFDAAAIQLFKEDSKDWVMWVASPDVISEPLLINLPYDKDLLEHSEFFNTVWNARTMGQDIINRTYLFDEKNKYCAYVLKHNPQIPTGVGEMMLQAPSNTHTVIMERNSALIADSWYEKTLSVDDYTILKRVAKVFEQAYIRFLDLQKAEAQAREAQIEAALERVRGKAMAMHSSEDLTATISAFYHELELFSITPRRCGVGLLDKETHMAELSTMNTTEQGESIEVIGRIKMIGHPVLEGVFDNWLLQKEYHPVLRGNEITDYYKLIRPQVAFPEYPNDTVQYGYFFFFTEGGVYAWTEKELTEDELKIYRRFTSVLSLTYKRYKDLKDAEARTQLAIRESSLDRVRAEIASMRTAEDLQRITPLVWRELLALGVPFFRCGVFIVNETEKKIHTYLSNPQGKSLAVLNLDYESSETNRKAVEHWRLQKVYVDHWDKEQFKTFAKSLIDQGQIETTNTYQGGEEPPESLTLQFIPFPQGMLYVGSAEPLSAAQIELVEALAEAFSVAYARYEDFTRLESAKAQIEKTLTDLKQTQTQLIQSEKMASLGELTAGIAHEIQNPLNFVNNFSEVSTELIDEMKEELAAGNQQVAMEIASDLKQNLEKINHHGKRADGIVKSMLQHSRKSTNQKELTDINALCDEYLRLSYHGLRAKDKSFNAKFEMHPDPDLPKLNVLPQDIGRVILNLINNAFYAVSEKLKVESQQSGSGYDPAVTISTKNLDGKIEIRVKDNGPGIPDAIKEKIFQPFFTTKPTGQGTGLGLSLSYDIVKAHGGELKVETEEGKSTVFIINLPLL